MTVPEMKMLAAELNRRIAPQGGCDHILKWTRRFLQRQDLDVEREVAALKDQGAFCDCEFMFNVYCMLPEPQLR